MLEKWIPWVLNNLIPSTGASYFDTIIHDTQEIFIQHLLNPTKNFVPPSIQNIIHMINQQGYLPVCACASDCVFLCTSGLINLLTPYLL